MRKPTSRRAKAILALSIAIIVAGIIAGIRSRRPTDLAVALEPADPDSPTQPHATPPRFAANLAPKIAEPSKPRTRPGFELLATHSHFPVGPNPHAVQENGFDKIVGDYGVFARNSQNGASFGVPNSDAPPTRKPAMTRDGDLHNSRVLDYFVQAGLPREQVKDVRVSTLMDMRGTASDSKQAPPEFRAFDSGVQRSVDGIPVPDSVAWARFNANDESVEEAVFWPAIPENVVDDAHRLETMLSDADLRKDYLAKLATTAGEDGRVVVRHSSFTVDEKPKFYACYDVAEKVGTGTVSIRHFDLDGNEVRLPQDNVYVAATERTK